MTLVFIFWGKYAGFEAVLACAKARAGCRIIVISDAKKPPQDVEHVRLGEFQDGLRMRWTIEMQSGDRWCSYSLARWFVLRELGEKQPDIFPVFCSDWDVMIFRNLAEAYAPFMEFDYTISREGGMESAAYGVNNPAALDAWCKLVEYLTPCVPNDMEAWSRLTRTGVWDVGNLFEIRNGSVFDHNMHSGGDRFDMQGEAKKVAYSADPYFELHDGTLIRANTMHLWGSYKSRAHEVLSNCGIPL